MQSSANTAWVGLIVIVSALLLSSAILVLGGRASFDLFGKDKYFVMARFDDVTGIDPGMTITANGQRVGNVEKIMEQEGGRIGAGPIDVKLRIDRRVVLGPEAKAIVTQPELLGDQILSLEGLAAPNEPAAISEGDTIQGVNGGGLAQTITAKAGELADELHSKLDLLMAEGMVTIRNVNEMLGSMNEMMKANKGAIQGTMKNVETASKNMIALSANLAGASEGIQKLANDPNNQKALQEVTSNLSKATANMAAMSESMNTLMSDPKLNEDLKGTIAAMRETTESLNASIKGLQPTMGKVNTLLDTTNTTMKSVGNVAAGVGGIVGGVSDAVGGGKGQAKAKAGIGGITSKVRVGLDVDTRIEDSNDDLSYSGDDQRTRDINAYLGYDKVFAEFGANDIGLDNSGLNFLLGKGDPTDGLSIKTGVINSEVGSEVSYRWDKNAGIDANMYDANDPKYNVYGRMPVGRSFSVLAGMQDITGDSEVTVGVGVSY